MRRGLLAGALVVLVAVPAALGSATGDYTDVRKDASSSMIHAILDVLDRAARSKTNGAA